MASTDSNNTSALYFIVGGLAVLAVIFGLFFYRANDVTMNSTAPAAGLERTSDPDVNPAAPGNQDIVPTENMAPARP